MLLCILLGQQQSSDYAKSGGPPLKASLSTYGKSAVYVSNASASDTTRKMIDFYQRLVVKAHSDFHLGPNAISGNYYRHSRQRCVTLCLFPQLLKRKVLTTCRIISGIWLRLQKSARVGNF